MSTPPWIQLGLPGIKAPTPTSSSQASPTAPITPPGPSTDPLFLDIYAGDNPHPAFGPVLSSSTFFGAILKATEGTYYNGGAWFKDNWKSINPKYTGARTLPWHRGCYHYLKFNQDGIAQAEYYLQTIRDAGGWEQSDLFPIVDVEMGGAGDSNQKATASQVVDCTTAFATRVSDELGRPCILYGNGAMRDLGIHSRMECEYLWLPRYTATLPAITYTRAGWTADRLLMWQYCGDGEAYLPGYPNTSPLGRTDISVLTLPGGLVALDTALKAHPVRP